MDPSLDGSTENKPTDSTLEDVEWDSDRVEVTEGDIGLVLWELNVLGAERPEIIVSRLADDMAPERTSEVLREAERRGLARELDGTWSLTEAGQTYVDE